MLVHHFSVETLHSLIVIVFIYSLESVDLLVGAHYNRGIFNISRDFIQQFHVFSSYLKSNFYAKFMYCHCTKVLCTTAIPPIKFGGSFCFYLILIQIH